MSDFRIDQITNQAGTAGPQVAGITTFNSPSGLVMPSGNTLGVWTISDNVVKNGLVLYLDAGNDLSYAGSKNLWRDLSGFGNDGTLTNGPTYNSSNGGSIVFDGTDDYITFNNLNLTTSSLGLNSSSGATLSCWLKITLLSRWTGVFMFWGPAGSVDFGWDINPSNFLRIFKDGGGDVPVSLLPYSGLWTNYVLVSNSSGTIFYINGVEVTTTSKIGNVSYNSGRSLFFGDNWDSPIQGNTSSISIYNRALSASEVLQNYNALKGRYGL